MNIIYSVLCVLIFSKFDFGQCGSHKLIMPGLMSPDPDSNFEKRGLILDNENNNPISFGDDETTNINNNKPTTLNSEKQINETLHNLIEPEVELLNSSKPVLEFLTPKPIATSEDIVVYPTLHSSMPEGPLETDDLNNDFSFLLRSELCDISLGQVEYNGTCERLLARGPCEKDEWLTISQTENVIECKKRPCPWGSVMHQDECVDLDQFNNCRPGQMLYTNYQGIAECDCEPAFHYMPLLGECVPEHEKGQCNFGEYIEISNETQAIECVKNPCVLDSHVYDKNTKQCYWKLFRGKCEHSLSINQEKRTAECLSFNGHNIFEVPTLRSCPEGSRRDFFRRCRKSFQIPTHHSSPSFYGKCPQGYSKQLSGSCKKIVSLFG